MAAPWWLCIPLHDPPPAPAIDYCFPPCPHPRRTKPGKGGRKLTPKQWRHFVKEMKRANRARHLDLWERYEMARMGAGDMLGNSYYGYGDGGYYGYGYDDELYGRDESMRKSVLKVYDEVKRAEKEEGKKGKKKAPAKKADKGYKIKELHIHLK